MKLATLEIVENGIVVRFVRAKKQKRQIPPERPDLLRLAREGAQHFGRALAEGEKWNAPEPDEPSADPAPAKLEEVYVLEEAAVFAGSDDELVKVVRTARSAFEEASSLGLLNQHAPAVPAGIGLSRAAEYVSHRPGGY